MEEAKISSDLIRGHIDSIILKLLLNGEKYGYAIGKLISTASDGPYILKEATMYSSLKRMEQEGLISSYWGDAEQGARRRYYKITAKGKIKYTANKESWEAMKELLDKLI
jgi:PadR family transcriptional regulator, regulatory protein PadR